MAETMGQVVKNIHKGIVLNRKGKEEFICWNYIMYQKVIQEKKR